ncbi:hypothetical protein ACFXTN_025454 [Malus domestica]
MASSCLIQKTNGSGQYDQRQCAIFPSFLYLSKKTAAIMMNCIRPKKHVYVITESRVGCFFRIKACSMSQADYDKQCLIRYRQPNVQLFPFASPSIERVDTIADEEVDDIAEMTTVRRMREESDWFFLSL